MYGCNLLNGLQLQNYTSLYYHVSAKALLELQSVVLDRYDDLTVDLKAAFPNLECEYLLIDRLQ